MEDARHPWIGARHVAALAVLVFRPLASPETHAQDLGLAADDILEILFESEGVGYLSALSVQSFTPSPALKHPLEADSGVASS